MIAPFFVGKVLIRRGFTALQTDGESLVDMCDYAPYRQSLLDELMKELPPPDTAESMADVEFLLNALLRHARNGPQSETFSAAQLMQQAQLGTLFRQFYVAEEIIPTEVKKWRHWTPSKLFSLAPTTQRSVELYLRSRWPERSILILWRLPRK